MNILQYLIVLFSLPALAGTSFEITVDKAKNWDVFLASIEKFPYEKKISAEILCKSGTGIPSPSSSMSIVKKFLGEPDIVNSVINEDTTKINTSWYYILRRTDSSKVDHDNDKGIAIYFDQNNNPKAVRVKNFKEISCLETGSIVGNAFERYVVY